MKCNRISNKNRHKSLKVIIAAFFFLLVISSITSVAAFYSSKSSTNYSSWLEVSYDNYANTVGGRSNCVSYTSQIRHISQYKLFTKVQILWLRDPFGDDPDFFYGRAKITAQFNNLEITIPSTGTYAITVDIAGFADYETSLGPLARTNAYIDMVPMKRVASSWEQITSERIFFKNTRFSELDKANEEAAAFAEGRDPIFPFEIDDYFSSGSLSFQAGTKIRVALTQAVTVAGTSDQIPVGYAYYCQIESFDWEVTLSVISVGGGGGGGGPPPMPR